MGDAPDRQGAAISHEQAEQIDGLYEEFLQTGDLAYFYKCLELSCSNKVVSDTAIDLIKTVYKDDGDGRPPIIAANRHQALFNEQRLQYTIWRSRGVSEGRIWRLFAEIYGIEADSVKRQFKRKLSEQQKG